jgi:iron-sulfur cluster repair protein YtfE (RIC family)
LSAIGTERHFDAREMLMVHNMFRREFLLAAGLVRRVIEGDDERAKTVGGHLEFMTNALHTHHGFEDRLIWPMLRERCPEDAIPDIARVADQHAALESGIAEVTESLAAWRCDAAADPRDRLASALDRLLPNLLQHMDFEEEYVVPVMAKHITKQEWDTLLQVVAADLPAPDMPLEFGMMMYEAEPEIVELAVCNMPDEMRTAIRQTAAQSFAEHSRRVHGTATPLRSSEIRRSCKIRAAVR